MVPLCTERVNVFLTELLTLESDLKGLLTSMRLQNE